VCIIRGCARGKKTVEFDEALRLLNASFTRLCLLGCNTPVSQYCIYALMDVNGLVFGEQKKNIRFKSL
jgi:hypothetical protein